MSYLRFSLSIRFLSLVYASKAESHRAQSHVSFVRILAYKPDSLFLTGSYRSFAVTSLATSGISTLRPEIPPYVRNVCNSIGNSAIYAKNFLLTSRTSISFRRFCLPRSGISFLRPEFFTVFRTSHFAVVLHLTKQPLLRFQPTLTITRNRTSGCPLRQDSLVRYDLRSSSASN